MRSRSSRHRAFNAVLAGLAALALMAAPGTAVASAAASPTPLRHTHVIPAPKVAPNPDDITPAAATTCATAALKAGWPMDVHTNTQHGTYRDIVIAVAIGMAESSCNPSAVNGSGSCAARGLWQIEQCYWPAVSETCLMNGQCNADASYNYVYRDSGFCAWQSFDTGCGQGYNGSWANYISDAETAVGNMVVTLGNAGTGYCTAADASQPQNGGLIWQWGCSSTNIYDEWYVYQPDGSLNPVLVNEGTGYCLDTEADQARDYGMIFQWSCDQTDPHQRWSVVNNPNPNDSDSAEFNLKDSGNGTCLAADANQPENQGGIWQWDCSGYSTNNYLRWN